MEQLPESSKKTNLMKQLLLLWRYLWLGVSIILECAMSGICFLGFFYFRKWNDKLMILAFALMFVWWAVITFAALVRARKEKKWVLLPELWMKMVLFVGTMAFFYLLAPVYPGAFWMGILTAVMVLLTFFIRHEFAGTNPAQKPYVPMAFLYMSYDKSEWLSAYYLWLAERSLLSKEFYERIGAEMTEQLKSPGVTPAELFEKAQGHVTEADISPLIYDFTRAYFCFGTAESLRMFPFLGSYEDACEMILQKKNMDLESPFDPDSYRELAVILDEVFEVYKIGCEEVNVIDKKTQKPLPATRVIRNENREIDVYAHPLVEDKYLLGCLEDFKSASGELQRIFSDDEEENAPKESLLFEMIRIFPPHGEDLVYLISGRKRDGSREELSFIIRNGALFLSGQTGDANFDISPWVLIRNEKQKIG